MPLTYDPTYIMLSLIGGLWTQFEKLLIAYSMTK